MRRWILAVIVLGLLSTMSLAADDADGAAVREAIRDFRKRFAADDMSVRMDALKDLAETRHPLAIEEIGKRVLTDDDPEVRMAGAVILARVGVHPEVAGPHLRDLLGKNDDHPEVQVEFIRAIRALGYQGAHDQLQQAAMRFLERDYRFVVREVMKTFGALKDVKALPFMLQLVEYNTETVKGRRRGAIRTGSVASQEQRKAMWKALYGNSQFPNDDLGFTIKWWLSDLVLAAKAITGEEFEDQYAFRNWLVVHRKELKIKASELDRRHKLKPPPPKHPPEEESED